MSKMETGVGNQYGDIQEVIERLQLDPNKIKMGGGKLYTQVSSRVEALRIVMGLRLSIETEILVYPGPLALKEGPGDVIVMRAVIRDESGRVMATGHAEEVRGTTRINQTSALENCETSAIGRALAALGVHGGEFASVNEIDTAKDKEARGVGANKVNQSGPPKFVPNGPGVMKSVAFDVPNPKSALASQAAPAHQMTLTAMAHFAGECDDLKVLRDFWSKNSKLIDDVRDSDPASFASIKEVFAQRSKELEANE